MSQKFGFSLLLGFLSIALGNAAGQKENLSLGTYTVTFNPDGTFTSTNRDSILQKLNQIILPEFGVPKELPLKTVLSRLSNEISKIDPKRTEMVFLTRSRAGPGHPRIEDFLIRIDPPLKNVSLRDACEAILAVAIGPLEQDRTIKIACSFGNNTVSFHEADLYPDEVARSQSNDSSPSDNTLAAGNYVTEPFKGLVRVPEPTIDTFFIIQPRTDEFDHMPTFRPDLQFQELIPRSQMNSQVLLDSASR